MKVEIVEEGPLRPDQTLNYELRASAPGEELLQPEVNRPFYFEDSQVVLQASHRITEFPSTINRLFTLYRWKDRPTKSIVIS